MFSLFIGILKNDLQTHSGAKLDTIDIICVPYINSNNLFYKPSNIVLTVLAPIESYTSTNTYTTMWPDMSLANIFFTPPFLLNILKHKYSLLYYTSYFVLNLITCIGFLTLQSSKKI